MLHLLLLILKILGILLLVILGIILAVLLLVLFVPLRYKADVEFDGKPRGNVLVSWLLRLITVRVSYDEGIKALVKILWFKVFETNIGGTSEEESAPEAAEAEDVEDIAAEFPEDEIFPADEPMKTDPKTELQTQEVRPKAPKAAPEAKKKPKQESKKEPEQRAQHEETEEKIPFTEKIFEKIRSIVNKLTEKIAGIYKNLSGKVNTLQEKTDQVKTFLADEENQNTLRLLWKQIFKLFRHILPRKLQGQVRFGFEDPYTTGQILTYISPFYGLYAKTLDVEPVFGEKVMEGELHLKGHIRVASMLWIVIRVFLNKNFRKILRMLTGKKK